MTRHRALDLTTTIVLVALMALPAWTVSPRVPELPPPGSPHMSRQDQEKLGLEAANEVYKQMPVLPDSSPVTQYVKRLGARLVKQIPPEYSWPYQFHVVQQKEINAFALPGGPIFINLGTITTAENEAQLAGVMSHEMSHVYMQHTAKSLPRQNIQSVLGALGSMLGGAAGTLARIGVAGTGVFLMKYSRADEAEADAVGAVIMYKAGYKPIELANFFELLKKQGGAPPQFLSDHPNPGNRTEAIQKEIQNWPAKEYLSDSRAFETVKSEAAGVRVYNAQEIADGAKQGLWAQQNVKTGAMPPSQASLMNVSFDEVKPGPQFTEISRMGVSISYPSNWTTAANQRSLTIGPKTGVSDNAIAYGAIVSSIEQAGAASLDQAAADLIRNFESSNPGLRQTGDVRRETAGGRDARAVDLAGNSPLEQDGKPLPERDWLVVTQGSGGSYVFLIFIAPEKDFARLRPTYQKMLDSLQLE